VQWVLLSKEVFKFYKSELGFLCTAKSESPTISKDGTTCKSDCQYEALRATLSFMIWMGRIGTFLGMWAGLSCLTQPVSVAPDIIPFVGPFIGDLVGSLLCCFNCLVACQCWLCFTAIMYVFYRPMIGIPLVCVAIALAVGTGYLRKEHGGKLPGQAQAGGAPSAQPVQVQNPVYVQQPQYGIQMAQPTG